MTSGTVTTKQEVSLDKFFETKDYHYLTTCILTINATPVEATVVGAGTYPYETVVNIVVECEGYITHAETLTLTEDVTLNIELEEDATDTEQKISEQSSLITLFITYMYTCYSNSRFPFTPNNLHLQLSNHYYLTQPVPQTHHCIY